MCKSTNPEPKCNHLLYLTVTPHASVDSALTHPRAGYQVTRDQPCSPELPHYSNFPILSLLIISILPCFSFPQNPQQPLWAAPPLIYLCLLPTLVLPCVALRRCTASPVSRDLWGETSSFMTVIFTSVCLKLVSESLSYVQLFAIPWSIQSTEFSRPEYWSG